MVYVTFYAFLASVFAVYLAVIPSTGQILHQRIPIRTIQTKIIIPKILTIDSITQLILENKTIHTAFTSNLIKYCTVTRNTQARKVKISKLAFRTLVWR